MRSEHALFVSHIRVSYPELYKLCSSYELERQNVGSASLRKELLAELTLFPRQEAAFDFVRKVPGTLEDISPIQHCVDHIRRSP